MKEFNNLKEMKPYYNKKTNTYEFMCDVQFNFNVSVMSNITALNITARDITALNINARHITASDINARNINVWNINSLNINARHITAWDITVKNIAALNINARHITAWDITVKNIAALNINANDINYYAVCFAYYNIECTSIKGGRVNTKHFVLDGKITIKPKTYSITLDGKTIELSEESYNNFKAQFKEETK